MAYNERRTAQRRQYDSGGMITDGPDGIGTRGTIERRVNIDRRDGDDAQHDARDDTRTYLIRISEADRDMYARALRCYAMFLQFKNENPMLDPVDDVEIHADMLDALEYIIDDGRLNDFTA